MIYLGKDRVNLNPNFAASSPAGLGAQADWAETDVNAAAYIKNKPGVTEALAALAEAEILTAIVDNNNKFLVDNNGKILFI